MLKNKLPSESIPCQILHLPIFPLSLTFPSFPLSVSVSLSLSLFLSVSLSLSLALSARQIEIMDYTTWLSGQASSRRRTGRILLSPLLRYPQKSSKRRNQIIPSLHIPQGSHTTLLLISLPVSFVLVMVVLLRCVSSCHFSLPPTSLSPCLTCAGIRSWLPARRRPRWLMIRALPTTSTRRETLLSALR